MWHRRMPDSLLRKSHQPMNRTVHSDFMLDQSALETWQTEQAKPSKSSCNAILEAAANNPIGLSLFARTVVFGESYDQAVAGVARLTNKQISNGAARFRVHCLRRA